MIPTFDEYLASLSAVDSTPPGVEPRALDLCEKAAQMVAAAAPLDRARLTEIVKTDPSILPVLAAATGLSQERFKTWLKSRFSTAGWIKLGRVRASELVDALDDDRRLVALLDAQVAREWTWADVLAATMTSRQRASSSVEQGRALEDAVQEVIESLGLAFQARDRFEGTGGRTGPADFAIPGAWGRALIAVAVKGFDSTGSKLTDAATEITTMAEVRKPTQFIFAVVDGLGWHRRAGDLRRIHSLWVENRIDGVFNLSTLPEFRRALNDAARRVRLIA